MDKYQFGTATVVVEGDLTISRNDGPVSYEIVKGFLDLVELIHKKYGRCFLIVDASKIYPVSKEARRYLVEWSKTHSITGTAVFGAGVVMRAVFTLASRAMSVLGHETTNTVYLATESDARSWVEDMRKRIAAKNAQNAMR